MVIISYSLREILGGVPQFRKCFRHSLLRHAYQSREGIAMSYNSFCAVADTYQFQILLTDLSLKVDVVIAIGCIRFSR